MSLLFGMGGGGLLTGGVGGGPEGPEGDFFGATFRLQRVTPLGIATLRVRYTQDPKLTEEFDGALRFENYSVTGPALNNIISAASVADDPQAVDLLLQAPLGVGTWRLNVINVVGHDDSPFEAPTSLTFNVLTTTSEESLARGAVNDVAVSVLRKYLHPSLKGPMWNAVLAGLATGDQTNWDNARRAFDQLFLLSASGVYLDRRAADQGSRRPPGLAMPDDLFRDLTVVSKTRKLTQDAILEVLEVFYGAEAVRASMTTSGPQKYHLEDEDDLLLVVDERDSYTITFLQAQFARINEASAVEVAAVISRQLHLAGSAAYAVVHLDEDGFYRVRMYSGRLGISSAVRVVGGKAQATLRFTSGNDTPDDIFVESVTDPLATWNITIDEETGNLRFTLDQASATFDDFNKLQEGDYVLVYGPSINPANRGTFAIKRVGIEYPDPEPVPVQWFEVENPAGEPEVVTQILYRELQFHRSRKRTIFDEFRHVVVSQAEGVVDIEIPVTTQAVRRRPTLAAYGVLPEPLELETVEEDDVAVGYSLLREGDQVVATTTLAHGLGVGDVVLVEGVLPRLLDDGDMPAIMTKDTSFERVYHRAVTLPEGVGVIVGGQTQDPVVVDKGFVIVEKTGASSVSWTPLLAHAVTTGQQAFGISVADTRIIVTGGHDGAGAPTDAYNILTYAAGIDDFVTGPMLSARGGHAQVTLGSKVLVIGGFETFGTEVDTVDEMDLDTLVWTPMPLLAFARTEHAAVVVPSVVAEGLPGVLVSGGRAPSISADKILSVCEFWDGTWSQTGSMSYARSGHALIALPGRRVLAIGGTGYNPSKSDTPAPLSSCEIWDGGSWFPAPSMSVARANPAAVYVPSTNSIVVSGDDASVEILDLATMRWRRSLADVTDARLGSQAILLGNLVLFAGGTDAGGETTAESFLFVQGVESMWSGGLNGLFVVTATDGDSFTYKTPGYYGVTRSGLSAPMVHKLKAAPADPKVPGPFVLNPVDGIAVTGISSTTAVNLLAGHQYLTLTLASATAFPDAIGWLVFAFGESKQLWPVRYLGRVSNTQLALDASMVFPQDLPIGTTVTLAAQREPYFPTGLPGLFYATGSAAGRVAAEEALEDTVGAGIPVDLQVVYPSDVGLGGEGFPERGNYKLSDAVRVWGGDTLAAEVKKASGH